jgi:nitroreductase
MSSVIEAPPASLHELLRARWSPREFSTRPIEPEKLRSLFEAASWAASCSNEQPWRYILSTKDEPEQFAKVLSLLSERNQLWAKTAWALGFSTGKKTFERNGAPNRFALHDTGAATANLATQATAVGLHAHFMGGFDIQRARTEFHVPDEFEIGAAFALGYIADPAAPPPPRTRMGVEEIVFSGDWGAPAKLIA